MNINDMRRGTLVCLFLLALFIPPSATANDPADCRLFRVQYDHLKTGSNTRDTTSKVGDAIRRMMRETGAKSLFLTRSGNDQISGFVQNHYYFVPADVDTVVLMERAPAQDADRLRRHNARAVEITDRRLRTRVEFRLQRIWWGIPVGTRKILIDAPSLPVERLFSCDGAPLIAYWTGDGAKVLARMLAERPDDFGLTAESENALEEVRGATEMLRGFRLRVAESFVVRDGARARLDYVPAHFSN